LKLLLIVEITIRISFHFPNQSSTLAASQLETFVRVVHACHESRTLEGTEFFAKFETKGDFIATKGFLGEISSGYGMFMTMRRIKNGEMDSFIFMFKKGAFFESD